MKSDKYDIVCIKQKKWIKMDTTFMSSKNSEISDLNRLLLNVTDKIKLKARIKYVALSNLGAYYIRKNNEVILKQ